MTVTFAVTAGGKNPATITTSAAHSSEYSTMSCPDWSCQIRRKRFIHSSFAARMVLHNEAIPVTVRPKVPKGENLTWNLPEYRLTEFPRSSINEKPEMEQTTG